MYFCVGKLAQFEHLFIPHREYRTLIFSGFSVHVQIANLSSTVSGVFGCLCVYCITINLVCNLSNAMYIFCFVLVNVECSVLVTVECSETIVIGVQPSKKSDYNYTSKFKKLYWLLLINLDLKPGIFSECCHINQDCVYCYKQQLTNCLKMTAPILSLDHWGHVFVL